MPDAAAPAYRNPRLRPFRLRELCDWLACPQLDDTADAPCLNAPVCVALRGAYEDVSTVLRPSGTDLDAALSC